MMYFLIFSLPATVLATSPARAAMSTKLILGGAGRELWEAALSPCCWAKVKQPNSKHPNVNAAIEKCVVSFLMAVLPEDT